KFYVACTKENPPRCRKDCLILEGFLCPYREQHNLLKKLIFRVLCALAFTLPMWAGKEFIAQPGEQTRGAELIIRLTPGANPASVVASVAPGSQIISHPASATHLIKVTNRPVTNASSDFARNPFVEFVEPNRIRHSMGGLPALNDPSSNLQWAL